MKTAWIRLSKLALLTIFSILCTAGCASRRGFPQSSAFHKKNMEVQKKRRAAHKKRFEYLTRDRIIYEKRKPVAPM
jgi:hypothetical protein